jgi:hypothetical protein
VQNILVDGTNRPNTGLAIIESVVDPFDRIALEYPSSIIKSDAAFPLIPRVLGIVPTKLHLHEHTPSAPVAPPIVGRLEIALSSGEMSAMLHPSAPR